MQPSRPLRPAHTTVTVTPSGFAEHLFTILNAGRAASIAGRADVAIRDRNLPPECRGPVPQRWRFGAGLPAAWPPGRPAMYRRRALDTSPGPARSGAVAPAQAAAREFAAGQSGGGLPTRQRPPAAPAGGTWLSLPGRFRRTDDLEDALQQGLRNLRQSLLQCR